MRLHTLYLIPLILLCTASQLIGASQEELYQLDEKINDPDQIVRLVAFENAIKSEDATLKRLALRLAMESSDSDLRALALRGALVGVNLLAFELTPKEGDEEDSRTGRMIKYYSNALMIQVKSYDFSTGNLIGYCMNQSKLPSEDFMVTGTVTGDDISLKSTCNLGRLLSQCSLKAELDTKGTLKGTFGCQDGNVSAKLSLL